MLWILSILQRNALNVSTPINDTYANSVSLTHRYMSHIIWHNDFIMLLFYAKQPINYFLSDEKCCTWLFAVIEPVRSRLFQLILISVQWIKIMCIKLYLIANKTLLRNRNHINSPILKNEAILFMIFSELTICDKWYLHW